MMVLWKDMVLIDDGKTIKIVVVTGELLGAVDINLPCYIGWFITCGGVLGSKLPVIKGVTALSAFSSPPIPPNHPS